MKKNTSTPRSLRVKNLLPLACLLAILSPFSPAYAADPTPPFDAEGIVAAINNARVEIVTQLTAAKDQLNRLFSNAFNSAFGLTPNAQVPNIALFDPSGYTFERGSNTTPITPYALINEAAKKSSTLKLENVLFNQSRQAQKEALLAGMDDSKQAIGNIDAQNFLRQLSYNTEAQNKAERMIALLAGSGAAGSIDLKELKEKEELNNSDAAKEYKIKTFSNAAIRSLLLGNLYEVFNARIPIKKLGEKSGMPTANASLAEVEQYAASRRIKNPDWYKTIDSAPSIAVQREIAFILAEMQWQLHTLHQDNEKMLQTMTALGIINLRMSAGMSTDQKEIELKQEVEGTAPKPPETELPETSPQQK